MRISRSIQLHQDFGLVHKYWRCHNREFLLQLSSAKDLYLSCTKYALNHPNIKNKVKLYSYCLMDNHTHMQIAYSGGSSFLSSFMRISHSKFGYLFNLKNGRSGKVANDRPKTPLIQDEEYQMVEQFYNDANPIRANKIKFEKLKFYKYSSFRFYAYGISDSNTSMLTAPSWYIKLGKTSLERQSKYRKLFIQYLKRFVFSSKYNNPLYIGSLKWVDKMTLQAKDMVKSKRDAIKKHTNTS